MYCIGLLNSFLLAVFLSILVRIKGGNDIVGTSAVLFNIKT